MVDDSRLGISLICIQLPKKSVVNNYYNICMPKSVLHQN